MSIARGVTLLTPGRGRGAEGAAIPERLGRVLLVEDERDVAELIRYNLVKEGYDVVLGDERHRRPQAGARVPPRRGPARHHGAPTERLGDLPAPQAGPGPRGNRRGHGHGPGRGRGQGPRVRARRRRLRDEAVLAAGAGRAGPGGRAPGQAGWEG